MNMEIMGKQFSCLILSTPLHLSLGWKWICVRSKGMTVLINRWIKQWRGQNNLNKVLQIIIFLLCLSWIEYVHSFILLVSLSDYFNFSFILQKSLQFHATFLKENCFLYIKLIGCVLILLSNIWFAWTVLTLA